MTIEGIGILGVWLFGFGIGGLTLLFINSLETKETDSRIVTREAFEKHKKKVLKTPLP